MQGILAYVSAIEKVTGGIVTCHVYDPAAAKQLPPILRHHRHRFCRAAAQTDKDACMYYCAVECRAALVRDAQPAIRRCPFGAWQCHVPLRRNGQIVGQIFLSPFALHGDSAAKIRTEEALDFLELRPALSVLADNLRLLELLASRIESALLKQSASSPRRRIDEFVAANCMGKIALKQLAAHLKISPSRASHAVRELTGKTFTHLLREHRIALARNLLAGSYASIGETARACGFANTDVFSKIFRKAVGNSPLKYRQLMRKEQIAQTW